MITMITRNHLKKNPAKNEWNESEQQRDRYVEKYQKPSKTICKVGPYQLQFGFTTPITRVITPVDPCILGQL